MLWTPQLPLRKFLQWSRWDTEENMDRDDDEDPGQQTLSTSKIPAMLIMFITEIIQGMHSEWSDDLDLGQVGRRDPDALPPQNVAEWIMYWVYMGVTSLSKGNCLYALKAGLLTGMLNH